MKDFSERAKEFTEYTEAPWGVMRAEMVAGTDLTVSKP